MAAAGESQLEFDLVQFGTGQDRSVFSLDLAAETLWATAIEMADLFHAPLSTVTKQIASVYADRELGPEDTRRVMSSGGKAMGSPAEHYNLDMILSVGYRLNSAKATAFRQWASRLLRTLVVDGFVLDEDRLRDNAANRNTLAGRLRAIRAEETSIYDSVRRCFEAAAEDYATSSESCLRFTRLLEDKFVFAVTGQSPADVLLKRADHEAPGMGLKRFSGGLPSMDEARLAENYLKSDELFVMHMICEQFLLLLQQKALRHRRITMAELADTLDGLLKLEGYPVLPSTKKAHAARAVRHAQAEFARYILNAKRPGSPATLTHLG